MEHPEIRIQRGSVMHTDYLSPIIQQLRDQQVRFAPREKKLEQVARAERLIPELEGQRVYTYEYLCYRITDYRPESFPGFKVSGKEAAHDLLLFVEDLSDAADVPVEAAGERVLTVEELSRQFHVSTKTISRWRQQGLVSRRFVFDGRRKRVGFLKSSVDSFVARNGERVRRGSRFSQLTSNEREEIVQRARRLGRAGGCPAEITRRVARKVGRSVETIRYTLKQFDREHPGLEVFPESTGPLSADAKKGRIYQQYRRGARQPKRVGEAILPHQDQRLPRDQRDAGGPDCRAAARLHPESAFFQGRRREGNSRSHADQRRFQENPAPQRLASLPGQLV